MAKTSIISGVLLLTALVCINSHAQHTGTPAGFANIPAYGVNSTTGGAGGEVVVINGQADAKKLQDALDDDDKPRIIYIQGQVQLPEYPEGTTIPIKDVSLRMTAVRSNKTILGLGDDAKIVKSGLSIYSGNGEGNPQDTAVNNIIIQNIIFEGAPDDCINIQGGSHHVWIDHCTFTDGPSPLKDVDGLIDIKRGSDYITISYCFFTNHYKMCLIGHSNKAGEIDTGHLRVTYDHCYFKDGSGDKTSSRHPRVRFGTVHVLNCFIDGGRRDCEGVVSQCDARVLIEGCHFRKCKSGGSTDEHSEPEGMIVAINNSFDNCGPRFGFDNGGFSADIFNYSYNPESSTGLPNSLPARTGAGKLAIQQVSAKPVEFLSRHTATSFIVDQNGCRVLLTGLRFNGENTAVNILDFSGRTIVSNRGLSGSEQAGYALEIQDLAPGMFILTALENPPALIGRFFK